VVIAWKAMITCGQSKVPKEQLSQIRNPVQAEKYLTQFIGVDFMDIGKPLWL
jgi:hypothetical protein